MRMRCETRNMDGLVDKHTNERVVGCTMGMQSVQEKACEGVHTNESHGSNELHKSQESYKSHESHGSNELRESHGSNELH